MKPNNRSIRELFSADVRYEVPRYQRAYVWEEDRHWEPLWRDIEVLYDANEGGQTRGHFLGAIVLQRDDAAPGAVTRWLVVDGQQRLTTLQLLIGAAADAAKEAGAEKPARLLRRLVANDEDVAASSDELLKVLPTLTDRDTFNVVMQEGGPPADAPDDDSNTIQEGFDYFGRAIRTWALGSGGDIDALNERYQSLYAVLGDLLQLVSIDLENDDDAQIIFETLNARGTPLLAIELIKNALLDRARKQGANPIALHDEVWNPEFNLKHWRQDRRQGRLTRPRSEIFLGHWLEMKLAEFVESRDLFTEFRKHLLDAPHSPEAAGVLKELCVHAKIMREFDSASPDSEAARFFRVVDGLDTTTFHPLALRLFTAEGLSPERRNRGLEAIESYLVRRMLRGMSPKSYTRLVVGILKGGVGRDSDLDDVVVQALASSAADSERWPTDEEIKTHLEKQHLYYWLSQRKIRLTFSELELRRRRSAKVEDVYELPKLSIEHVLPRKWQDHWPLPDGHSEEQEIERDALIDMLGNLTLVTGQLNSSMSNQSWGEKRERLGHSSVLLLNREFADRADWDESAITARGAALVAEILDRWPSADSLGVELAPTELSCPVGEHESSRAELSVGEVVASYMQSPEPFAKLLDELATDTQPRTYGEIAESLGWPPAEMSSVLAGYATTTGRDLNDRRPYRINKDEQENWWMWLDEDRAAVIRELSRTRTVEA